MAAIMGWYSCGKSMKLSILNSALDDIGNPAEARVLAINLVSFKNRVIVLLAKVNSFEDK